VIAAEIETEILSTECSSSSESSEVLVYETHNFSPSSTVSSHLMFGSVLNFSNSSWLMITLYFASGDIPNLPYKLLSNSLDIIYQGLLGLLLYLILKRVLTYAENIRLFLN
jgi:hypothetical protein